jgi:fructose/tagatose bisphosphate aldolase
MATARRGGYAVAYFEPWDESCLLAILRGAERAREPIMIGQSGIYLPPALGMEQRFFPAYALAGRLAAEAATVPVAYLFNETPYWDWAQAALGLGFNVVMYSNSEDDPETHVRKTAELVQLAAAVGVEVQSEVGSLLGGEHDNTDPEVAADFARRTGVHALGITAGNRHLTTGKYRLDLELIARLAEAVPVPLVLHGGSGAEAEELREAARRGVAQVNYGTAQRLVFLERLQASLAEDWRTRDPHELLGTGLPADVLRPALEAVSALVAETCAALGAEGQ